MSQSFQIARIAAHASKFIAKRDRKMQEAIADAFSLLQGSPFHHPNPNTIRRLHGQLEGLYRFQIGKIRIIYSADVAQRVIEILNIDNRGDVYK